MSKAKTGERIMNFKPSATCYKCNLSMCGNYYEWIDSLDWSKEGLHISTIECSKCQSKNKVYLFLKEHRTKNNETFIDWHYLAEQVK